jgi:hypothetical protein
VTCEAKVLFKHKKRKRERKKESTRLMATKRKEEE